MEGGEGGGGGGGELLISCGGATAEQLQSWIAKAGDRLTKLGTFVATHHPLDQVDPIPSCIILRLLLRMIFREVVVVDCSLWSENEAIS